MRLDANRSLKNRVLISDAAKVCNKSQISGWKKIHTKYPLNFSDIVWNSVHNNRTDLFLQISDLTFVAFAFKNLFLKCLK